MSEGSETEGWKEASEGGDGLGERSILEVFF
jgi:hypothetical protein